MKTYSTLLSTAVLVGILSVIYSKDYIRFSRADTIALALGPLLSEGALIILPKENDTYFAELTQRFTDKFYPDITAVVRVGAESDVPLVIKYARKNNRAILAGSGRHGWGVSLNNIHNAIMIDIEPLSSISIDVSTNTMTVGGGIKVGNVMAAVQAAGKECAAGICDCVGLLGAGLGGGHGRLQGLYGLIADNLISAHLATATGEMITVSNTSNSDLLWGLRGAGHNFGIVTEAVFNVYDQTNEGMQLNAELIYGADQVEAIFTAINEFKQNPATTVFVLFLPQPGLMPMIVLSFISSASTAKATSELNSAFGHIPHLTRTESVLPWSQMNSLGAMGLGSSACASTDRKNLYSASVIHYDIPTIRALYNKYSDFITANPSALGSVVVFESYSVHGVQAVQASETAYANREERHIIMLLAGYPDASMDGVAERWMKESINEVNLSSGFEKPAVYLNYAQGTEGFGAMYGYDEWRQERLKGLKRKYDPEGVFSGYHPIPRS